jgi:parvulin-like peptidyl-prolyl isomerase
LNNLDADRLAMEVERMAYDLALEKLLLREVEKNNITLEEGALDSAVSLHYVRAGNREAFKKQLDELGIDPEFVEQDIRDGLLVDRLIQQVVYRQVDPPEENELKQIYQQTNHDLVSFRHLVLGTRDDAKEELKRKQKEINAILDKAKRGHSFENLVRNYSEDSSSRASGGLYENLERGMMEATIESVAFSTPPGKISDVFITLDGYNLIKVESRKSLDFEEFKNREFESIYQKRKYKAYREYIDMLKKESGFIFLGL